MASSCLGGRAPRRGPSLYESSPVDLTPRGAAGPSSDNAPYDDDASELRLVTLQPPSARANGPRPAIRRTSPPRRQQPSFWDSFQSFGCLVRGRPEPDELHSSSSDADDESSSSDSDDDEEKARSLPPRPTPFTPDRSQWSLLQRAEERARRADDWVTRKFDKVTHATIDSMLNQVGNAGALTARDYCHDGPSWVRDSFENSFAKAWETTLQPTLRESMVGAVKGDFNRHLLRAWSKVHPSFCPYPYSWFRSTVLYALYPADKTLFGRFKNPWYVILMLLKLSNYTSVPVFGITWLLIDRRDEFQVCQFILTFKAYQFMLGIYYATTLALAFYSCLLIEESEVLAAVDGAARHPCDALMPSMAPEFPFVMVMEVVRLVLVFRATALLKLGLTVGGPGELRALAEVRLDAADGTLDGYADIAALRQPHKLRAADHTVAELQVVTERARRRFGAQVADGNALPSLMSFDTAIGAAVLVWGVLVITRHAGWSLDEPVLWHTLFYMKMIYGLGAFPFVLFLVPIIGEAMHGAHYTGYDKRGLCVPRLSPSQVIAKEEKARKRAAKLEKLRDNPLKAKWKASKLRRWVRIFSLRSNR